jgi:hypothetical protein
MENEQFSIMYNGQPVAVTVLGNNSFMVQITYRPLRIRLHTNVDGAEYWVDEESNQVSRLSKELGNLISARLYAVPQD